MNLRTILAFSASALGILGIAAAVSLVWTAKSMEDATYQLGAAIESVRAAEELEVTLFQHDQQAGSHDATLDAESPLRRQKREAVLRWLDQVETHIGSPGERDLVLRVRQRAEAYLAAGSHDRPELLRATLEAAEELVHLNVSQARAARDGAERIARFANASGIGVSVLLLAGIALVIAAAHARVYRPLIAMRNAITAYKSGNKGERAVEEGPTELREIAAEFNEMAGILADQQESQLRFVAGVAHDIRNPLQVLKMSAALLARGGELPADARARQLLDKISSQAERLDRMVEDLLDRTRIEAGALELRMENTDLREVAEEVVELHRSMVTAHVLELAAPGEPVRLLCDPGRMSQVLTNLVNNAIKYSPHGGHVRVTLASGDDHALVTVADEGVGIPADEREHIFEPFRRSDRTKANIPGIGLGLSVARRIVRAHGGEIRVESVVGKGTTFRVELPRHAGTTQRSLH